MAQVCQDWPRRPRSAAAGSPAGPAVGPGELLVRDRAPRSLGILHDYEPYLRERQNSGCANATTPWQEIRARGCSGVRDHLARFRGNAVMPARLRR